MSKKLKKLALSDVRDRIAALRRVNRKSVELPVLVERFKQLFHNFATTVPFLEPGQKLYRAVRWEKKHSVTSRLSYPPADRVTAFGRVNRPGQPMFYCSVAWNAPLFELRVEPNEHIALSRWRVTERLVINNVGYTDRVFERLRSDRPSEPNWRRRDGSMEGPVNRLLQRFFSEEFAQEVPLGEEHLYKIPNAIAEILLHDVHECDRIEGVTINRMAGLLYPAMAMLGHADNLVLKPDIVDSYLQLEQVEYMRINKKEVDGKFVTYHSTHLDFADRSNADGVIEWKGRPARWNISIPPGGMVRSSIENGRQIYRDADGRVIEPS